MAKFFLLLVTLIAVNGFQDSSYTYTDLINFSKGLLQGLSTDPLNACTIQANTDFDPNAVINVIDDIEQNIMSLSEFHFYAFHYLQRDLTQLLYLLTPSISNCDVKRFTRQLDGLFSIQGLKEMANNFKTNSVSIKNNVISISQCGENYSVCGNCFGETIKLIIGSGI